MSIKEEVADLAIDELNAAIAREVMGEEKPDDTRPWAWHFNGVKSEGGAWFATTTGYEEGDDPVWVPKNFASDESFAFEVAEVLRQRGMTIEMLNEDDDDYGYGVGFWIHPDADLRKTWFTGLDVAEVICRSALTAVREAEN